MIPDYVVLSDAPGDVLKESIDKGSYSSVGVLVDENTLKYCYPIIQTHLPRHQIIKIKSGESAKNIQTSQNIWHSLTKGGFDRNSMLINLGGGVVCDMGGFCAASFKRGIDFVNIPTTLLSLVDASIGGKLGIDFDGFKNQIGFFKSPKRVIISPEFLSSLPERQIVSGFAEILKHALIFDAHHFEDLKSPGQYHTNEWKEVIHRSLEIKGDIVTKDPQESGLRKILNFGHTIGHAVESYFLSSSTPLLHGEAIAIGMICESWLSTKLNTLSGPDLEHIKDKLINIFGKKGLGEINQSKMIDLLRQDKKNKGNTILMTLLNEPGIASYDIIVKEEEALESLEYYCSI